MKTMIIPVDPRNGIPLVTTKMETDFNGKFSWKEEAPYYDEHGKHHAGHVQTINVPWSICKDIYRRMAMSAANEEDNSPNMFICVYCGTVYPEGTSTDGSKILTEHIKVCQNHPLRKAEVKITKLRKALEGLVGASNKEELQEMGVTLRTLPPPVADKTALIDALQTLVETVEAD